MGAELSAIGRARLLLGVIVVSLVLVVTLGSTAPSAAQPSPEWIRVAIVRGAAQLNLQVHGAFTMDAIDTGDRIDEGSKLKPVRVQATAKGLALGDRWITTSGVRIQSERDGPNTAGMRWSLGSSRFT